MGGGARGVALAGAVKRIDEEGTTIKGFAGVSAGSLVAAMRAVGYTGDEILKELLGAPFEEFLDGFDGNLSVKNILDEFSALKKMNWYNIYKFWRRNKLGVLVGRLTKDYGLYEGDVLQDWIKSRIEAKIRPDIHGAIKFGQLKKQGINIKIIAANLKLRKCERFDADYFAEMELVEAISASTAIPLMFKPVQAFKAYYVDGGIVSNFPLWAFANESKECQCPIVGLKLSGRPSHKITSFPGFCSTIMNTALEGSNEIQNLYIENVLPVEIDTKGFSALDFSLNAKQKNELFKRGYESMDAYIQERK